MELILMELLIVYMLLNNCGVVWIAMGQVFISRKSCKTFADTVKSPKRKPPFTFSKAIQWVGLESLADQSWPLGLMLDTLALVLVRGERFMSTYCICISKSPSDPSVCHVKWSARDPLRSCCQFCDVSELCACKGMGRLIDERMEKISSPSPLCCEEWGGGVNQCYITASGSVGCFQPLMRSHSVTVLWACVWARILHRFTVALRYNSCLFIYETLCVCVWACASLCPFALWRLLLEVEHLHNIG